MPKILSFICQKGGTGKSTMTKVTAAYFNYNKQSCVVVDSDFPQHSLYKQRHDDLLDLSTEGRSLPSVEELQKQGIKLYPIDASNVETSSIRLTALQTSKTIEYVLVDLAGTLNVNGIGSIINQLDMAIVPCELEMMSIRAAMDTVGLLTQMRADLPICFLWSRVDTKHSITLREEIQAVLKKRYPDVYFFDFIAFKSRDYRDANTVKPAPASIKPFIKELEAHLKSFLSLGSEHSGVTIS